MISTWWGSCTSNRDVTGWRVYTPCTNNALKGGQPCIGTTVRVRVAFLLHTGSQTKPDDHQQNQ